MAIKPIEILINAKDNASSVFDGLKGKIVGIGVAIAGYFGVQAFAGVIKGAADFEQGMSRVKAATGATVTEMAELRKVAEETGANTKFTSTEAASALETLAKAGLSAKDAIATLPAVLNLAQAGDIELATASEYVTKAVMGMGLAFADAGRVADVLALGANATNTSVTGLAQALSYAAPVAQSAGVSLEGTVAIMGKLADAGIDASRSGTAVANMMAQFSDPASAFKLALGQAGITTNNFEEALHQLAAAGPRGEKAILAVGLNAGPALRALLNQGMPALDELKAKLEGAAGSAEATAKIMQDNLSGSFKGLISAWDAVKNALGTPVLPVLKDGVDQLAGAFKNAVADGTITKFGDAIATAFQAGIKWVREFAAQVDFTQLTADMRAFADRAGEVFTQIGEYATNAGSTVKIAVGGVQTAFGLLMVTAGGLSNAMVLMFQVGLKGFELLYRASEKLTFGKLREQYKAIADDFKLQSDAMGAASAAVSAKIRESLGGIGNGLGNVKAGFEGLTKSTNDAKPAADAAAKAFDDMGKKLEETRQKSQAAQKATEAKTAADIAATAAIRQLKVEYADLVTAGRLQEAAEKLQEINKAMLATPAAAKDAAKAAQDAAKLIEAAFVRQGIVSSEALATQAKSSLHDYELIKNAGTSSAQDIGNMFKKAAEDAIAANKGIAPPWVAAEAAAKGFELAVDAAGKATLRAADAGKKSVDDMSQSFAQSAEQVKKYEEAMDKMLMKYKLSADYSENQLAILEKENALIERRIELENKRLNRDKEGFSLDTGGKRVNMAIDTQASTYSNAKSQGLSEEQALKVAARFINERGEKMGWQGGGFGGLNQGQTWGSELQKAIDKIKLENAATAAQAANTANAQAPAAPANAPVSAPAPQTAQPQPPQPGGGSSSMATHTVNINLGGAISTVNTDAAGANVLQDVLSQLAAARRTSSR